ncbi:hypothetical protein CTA2_10370 [Colletotrichum tanaceti]|uniref:Uncharacterized protein n=1 Tax=Colletotrichum tanaceti TaxID=1306861 RepID=A0A4U6X0W4_9PEZI|nr:hypothetical protein CTA2_10370 [Colletotrichum tanaceti]TKW48523.1 hypothetical protein CTA1_139 [Colletotrichum tanaceti]
MCNIFYLVSDCPLCSKSTELGHINHACFQIDNTSNFKIGTCGTVTSQLVPGPQDIVCHVCCRKAQQGKKKEEEGGEEKNRVSEENKIFRFRSSVMSPVDERRRAIDHRVARIDSVLATPCAPPPTFRLAFPHAGGHMVQARHENDTESESALEQNPSQASQNNSPDGDDDGNPVDGSGSETIAQEPQHQEAEQKKEEILSSDSSPSTTEGLALETPSAELKRRVGEKQREHIILHGETSIEAPKETPSPVETIAALAKSRAQPPRLQTVMASDSDHIHQQTPRSARELRIESPWDTKAVEELAEGDPWWYPEIWGPAKHLPVELAGFLGRLRPAYDFHGHRIFIFCDDDVEHDAVEKRVTILLVTPGGTRARVVSGELYDEGARLVTRRQLARARYEELSAEEREKMARGEQCCVFHPCRVACCPMLHEDGQHRPMAPKGETLLSAMKRGYYEWRKNWGPGSPRPAFSASSSRPPGSPPTQPGRRFPIAHDWELGAEEERPGRRRLSNDSTPETGDDSDERAERFAFRGRVGRIRPGYHRHSGTRRDGSPVPRAQRARRPLP